MKSYDAVMCKKQLIELKHCTVVDLLQCSGFYKLNVGFVL